MDGKLSSSPWPKSCFADGERSHPLATTWPRTLPRAPQLLAVRSEEYIIIRSRLGTGNEFKGTQGVSTRGARRGVGVPTRLHGSRSPGEGQGRIGTNGSPNADRLDKGDVWESLCGLGHGEGSGTRRIGTGSPSFPVRQRKIRTNWDRDHPSGGLPK
jgi:hypothetical protein